jgi:hypothetical protein
MEAIGADVEIKKKEPEVYQISAGWGKLRIFGFISRTVFRLNSGFRTTSRRSLRGSFQDEDLHCHSSRMRIQCFLKPSYAA